MAFRAMGAVAALVVVAAAAFYAGTLAPRTEPLAMEGVGAAPAPIQATPAPGDAPLRLREENAVLRERIAALEAEVARLGEARAEEDQVAMADALGEALRVKEKSIARREVEALLWRTHRRTQEGGFDRFLEWIALVAYLSQRADDAARVIADLAMDHESPLAPLGDRDFIPFVLGLLPTPEALDALMAITASGEQAAADDTYGSLFLQLAWRDSRDVRPHLPELRRRLQAALDADGDPHEGLLRSVALGYFIHGDTSCLSMLRQRKVQERHMNDLFAAAQYAHTDDARQFLERVARTHRMPAYRQQAQQALEDWESRGGL
jgi:hypothetical protein